MSRNKMIIIGIGAALIATFFILWIPSMMKYSEFIGTSSSFDNNPIFLTSDCAAIFDDTIEYRRNLPDNLSNPEQTKIILEDIEKISNDFRKNNCAFTVEQWEDDVKNRVDFAEVDWEMLQAIETEAQMKK